MPSYSDEGFEQLSKTVRATLGIDTHIMLDPIDFLRRLKHTGYIRDYIRLPDISLPEAEAKYNSDDKKIYLRESVYREAERGNPHYRFTIFHEGSHALLGHQNERKRSFTAQAQSEKRVKSIRLDEDDADRLTAAIMAPYDKADFALATSSTQIATRFGLSPKAAEKRYDEYARLYRRANNLLRPLPKGVVNFLTEQRRRGHIVTSLPKEDVAAIQPSQAKYTGDMCSNPACGAFKMVRNGTATTCDVCGTATGDD